MDSAVGIEAVIFDWGGTLTPWHTIDLAASWATVTDDPALVQRLCAAELEIWARSRDHHRSASLAEILTLAQFTPSDPTLAAYHRWWDEHTYTDPQARPMLEALRARGLKIGILSNTIWERGRHQDIFDRDGIADLIDGAVYSSEIEWTKPHPLAFRTAMEAVGVSVADRAVFVGDRLFDDIHGAQSVGLRTIFIPHSVIPDEQIGAQLGEPDATVHELSEVPAIIDSWSR